MNAKQINEIERLWKARAEALEAADGIKAGGKRYRAAQANFFSGAIAAAAAIDPANKPSPRWVFAIMRGDDIAKLEPLAEGNEEVAKAA